MAEPGAGRLVGLLEDVEAALTAGDRVRFNAGLAYALLAAWAAHGRPDAVTVGADVHPAVARAARLLRDDTDGARGLDAGTLAARAGLSASRLSRLFHAQTGVTLVDYRNRQRLDRFWKLYGTGRRWRRVSGRIRSSTASANNSPASPRPTIAGSGEAAGFSHERFRRWQARHGGNELASGYVQRWSTCRTTLK